MKHEDLGTYEEKKPFKQIPVNGIRKGLGDYGKAKTRKHPPFWVRFHRKMRAFKRKVQQLAHWFYGACAAGAILSFFVFYVIP